MIGTIEISVHANRPNIPLNPMVSFMDSPSTIRLTDIPTKVGKWRITQVVV